MTTIIRIALTIAIAGATYAACDRHADASECAQSPAVARAEATASRAGAIPDNTRRAR
jgi:hypothetical protein